MQKLVNLVIIDMKPPSKMNKSNKLLLVNLELTLTPYCFSLKLAKP